MPINPEYPVIHLNYTNDNHHNVHITAITIVIHGDGNCMFRATAFAVGDANLGYAELRQKVCNRVPIDPNIRDVFRKEELTNHVSALRQNGQWGTELELVGTAHVVLHRINNRLDEWCYGSRVWESRVSRHPPELYQWQESRVSSHPPELCTGCGR